MVEKAGVDPLNFDVAGRDVLLPADIGREARGADRARSCRSPGVRRVTEVEDLTGAALSAKTVAKLQAEAAKAEAEAKAARKPRRKEAAAKAALQGSCRQGTRPRPRAARRRRPQADAAAEAAAKEAAAKEAAAKEAAAKEAAAKEAAAKEAAAKEAAAKEAARQRPATPRRRRPRPPMPPAPLSVSPAQACQSKLPPWSPRRRSTSSAAAPRSRKQSLPVLEKLGAVLAQCPAVAIEVAGHTDAGGKKAANQALSERRAEAVVRKPDQGQDRHRLGQAHRGRLRRLEADRQQRQAGRPRQAGSSR